MVRQAKGTEKPAWTWWLTSSLAAFGYVICTFSYSQSQSGGSSDEAKRRSGASWWRRSLSTG
jgi:hypothetical protein